MTHELNSTHLNEISVLHTVSNIASDIPYYVITKRNTLNNHKVKVRFICFKIASTG